ncbi:MAG: hypothetical protein KC897_01190 [Candidatus Omnitrophica bacterium]|nr:hypothetical protein [Candidatus Omnitrophota bacterium]MCB9720097.1 hypothetical protein [Candidatus Omnitrophota bacterium]
MTKQLPIIFIAVIAVSLACPAAARIILGAGMLQSFQDDKADPQFVYGTEPAAGRIVQEEDGQRYFEFRYGDTREVERPPHAGYRIALFPVHVTAGSQLTFRYRTDHIRDLRLALTLANQRLGFHLQLEPSAEWKTLTLPLAEKYNHPIDEAGPALELSIITFAPYQPGAESSYLQLDDFQLTESGAEVDADAVRARVDEERDQLARLEHRLRIYAARMSQDSYAAGETVEVDYALINSSDEELPVPKNTDYSREFYLVGAVQSWIIPVDPAGPRLAAGGSIVPVGKDRVGPVEEIPLTGRYTKTLAPGEYEWLIQFKKVRSEDVIDEVRLPFAVTE